MSFTIYQASAGSGKTFSLAKEYLKITLVNPDAYKNILAITFTNKAAAEMKERIMSYLGDLDSGDVTLKGYTDILPLILQETSLTEENALKNASILLKNIMYNYADFSIMTIDAFFQRILRTFAYDLDIPLNFQLDIDSTKIAEQVVEFLIEQVGENEDLTKIMIDFVHSAADNSKSWHVEKDIMKFTPDIFNEKSKFFIDKLNSLSINDFTKIIQDFVEEKRFLLSRTKSEVEKIQNLLEEHGIPEDDFYLNFIGKWVKSIKNEEYKIPKEVRNIKGEITWFSKVNYKKHGSAFKYIEDEIRTCLIQTLEDVQRVIFINTIQKQIFPMALTNEIKLMLNNIENQEHTFQLSNTNFKLYEITSQEPTPFIYERLGDKYYYYFVDEFQDTSRLQWLNLLPLICEALSAYHGIGKGKTILFGDPKQAIYRFRGGDVNLFVALPKIDNPDQNPIIDQMEGVLKYDFNSIPLETNYRSFENVVTFNNHLFQYIVDKHPSISPYYKNHHQKFLSTKSGGWVTIDEKLSNKEIKYSNFALSQIHAYIVDALDNGFTYKDIAILTRDKKHAPEIAQYLNNLGFPIVSSESLLIASSDNVLFVIALLRFYFQIHNQVLAYSLISKFNTLFGFKDVFLSSSDFSYLSIERYFLSKGFQMQFKDFNALSMYERMEYIIRAFFSKSNADIYLLTLLNLVHEKTEKFYNQEQFWAWWDKEEHKLSVEISDSINGITLLTIHKSKGLEFPVLIFPDYKTNNSREDIWINLPESTSDNYSKLKVAKMRIKEDSDSEYMKEISNEMESILIDKVNVLYVALTRAIERLHIIIDTAPISPTSFSYPYILHSFAKDFIDLETQKQDDYTHYSLFSSYPKKGKNESFNHSNTNLQSANSVDWKTHHQITADKTKTKAQKFGVLFHLIMSKIQAAADVKLAIEFVERTIDIGEASLPLVEKMISEVINHPLLSPYFAEDSISFNEKEIVDTDGNIHVPDKVIIFENKTIIIDFKTGTFEKYHHDQLMLYKQLYSQMGYPGIKSYLVYVNENALEIKMV